MGSALLEDLIPLYPLYAVLFADPGIPGAGLGPAEISALDLGCSGRVLAHHMLHDKKMDAGTLPFLLLRSIGAAFLAKDVALEDVAQFLDGELQAH